MRSGGNWVRLPVANSKVSLPPRHLPARACSHIQEPAIHDPWAMNGEANVRRQGVLRLHSANTINNDLRLLHHQEVPAIPHVLDRVVVVPVGHLVRPDRRHDGITHPGQERHGDVRDRPVQFGPRRAREREIRPIEIETTLYIAGLDEVVRIDLQLLVGDQVLVIRPMREEVLKIRLRRRPNSSSRRPPPCRAGETASTRNSGKWLTDR